MSICVIGSGLSGLAFAIRLKLHRPDVEIMIISNQKAGNTVMAGQRFRPRVAFEDKKESELLIQVLERRNNMVRTPEMERYASTAIEELQFWTQLKPRDLGIDISDLHWDERPEWFGPQWGRANADGNGRGKDVVSWLSRVADAIGVKFFSGTARQLHRRGKYIDYVVVDIRGIFVRIKTDFYVLAGGSIGGTIFNSTNVPIKYSPQHLLYESGLDMVGCTLNMFHILGYSNSAGATKVGCFETDRLADAEIYLKDPVTNDYTLFDDITTELLRQHRAHYYFDDIAKRFLAHGGVVEVRFSDGTPPGYGRVSHHYNHMAARTTDGVLVHDTANLYAVGDASGCGYWSGYQVRLPGAALTTCLVTASHAARSICDHLMGSISPTVDTVLCHDSNVADLPSIERAIRDINTKRIFDIQYTGSSIEITADNWHNDLQALKQQVGVFNAPLEISLAVADIFRIHGRNTREPIVLSRHREHHYAE